MSSDPFRALCRVEHVRARADLGPAIPAGTPGTVHAVLGQERRLIVRFGQELLRCTPGDIEAIDFAARSHRRSRQAA